MVISDFFFGTLSAIRLLRLLILLASPLNAAPPDRLTRDRTMHGYVSVHYPQDFDSSKRYHMLFWFHGTGGKPSRGIAKHHPGYIGVGMSYLKKKWIPPGTYGASHWKECLKVRRDLEEHGLQLGRNIVAGMSKGGWTSFYIGSEVPDGPDAVGIFAAGKDVRLGDPPTMPKTLSVLVGIGETDPNYPQAQLAVDYFRQGGAQVVYEEWLGRGHTYEESPRVVSWLDMESKKDHPQELQEKATRVVSSELLSIGKISGMQERYVALRHLMGHPCTPYASDAVKEKVRRAGRAAAASKDIKSWIKSLGKLRALVSREKEFFATRSFDVPKLQLLIDHYHTLMESLENPALAARAAYGAIRAQKLFNIYSAQIKAFETAEFKALTSEHARLQKIYREAGGNPESEVMEQLRNVGAKLSERRFNASINAFRAERNKDPSVDPKVDVAIESDPKNEIRPYSGLGF